MIHLPRKIRSLLLGPGAPYLWFLVLVGVLAHRNWYLSTDPIAVGDWSYLWPQWMQGFAGPPVSWVSEYDLGYYNLNASIHWVQASMGGLSLLGIGYNLSERLFFFWPAGILPGLAMYYFVRRASGRVPATVAGLVYELNTAGMFLGGAHLTHAMAYALAPFALAFLRNAVVGNSRRNAVAFGLCFSLLMAYEPRYAYIVGGVVVGYLALLSLKHPPLWSKERVILVSLMIGLPAAIHAYWLVPTLLYPSAVFSQVPSQLFRPSITLPYALALYNPFWNSPLATFQVQPLPWFAFLLPLFAAVPLMRRRIDAEIFFFALIALVGVFLTKQNNPPLAEVYPWLFAHFPGFSVFRESSKFFVLPALGYSILLGGFARDLLLWVPELDLWRHAPLASPSRRKAVAFVVVVVATAAALAPSQPAFANSLGFAFDTTAVPPSYANLSRLIDKGNFSRTLWFLTFPLFGFRSNEHPAVNATSFLLRYQDDLPGNALLPNLLDCLSVRYIVETSDTTYSGDSSLDFVRNWFTNVTAIPSLRAVTGIPGVQVWENPDALPLIYGLDLSPAEAGNASAVLSAAKVLVPFQEIGVDTYRIRLPNSAPRMLVLSEGYDGNWLADVSGRTVVGTPLFGMLNGFDLGGANGTTITVSYRVQPFFEAGAGLSIAIIALGLVFLASPADAWGRLRKRLGAGRSKA